MNVKIHHAVANQATGIPRAAVRAHSVGPDSTSRARVVVTIQAEDRGVMESFASVRMSAVEARDIAAALIREAERAEASDIAEGKT